MAGEPVVCLVGNTCGDPELKFLPSGVAVCSFTVATTPRVKKDDAWTDGEAMFVRCSVWRQMAESVAESIQKGTRVVVTGRLSSRSYETKQGEKRTSLELQVDDIGASLKYATVVVNRVTRQGADTSGGSDDPWTKPAQAADDAPF